MDSQWLAGSTILRPPATRVGFYETRACAPRVCPRCASQCLRPVVDGLVCSSCPWHAVIQEDIRVTLAHGYLASKAAYEMGDLDNREGVSTKFFRPKRPRDADPT